MENKLQARELRIGNYVQHSNGESVAVWMLTGSTINGIDNTDHGGETFKPIPLTETELVKLGATELSIGGFKMERFKLNFLKGYGYWYVTDFETGAYLSKIEFVHEWQNFYFVLQGQELTYK